MSAFPKSVKVAAFDFKIEPWTAIQAHSSRKYGECSVEEFTIRIQENLDHFKAIDSLMHEIGHAIYWAYSIEDEDKEERVVSTFGTAWTQVFRDNPDVIRFLTEALQEAAR